MALVLPLFAASLGAGPVPKPLTLWPGYTVELPAGHCVQLSRGPDFDVVYFLDEGPPKGSVLVGIYSGHNPENLECKTPAIKDWSANGLSFNSVRGSDGCAEFLVRDPKKPERGFLHIWFGPAAKDRALLAEGVVSSVRPSALPVYRPDDLPLCK